MPDQQCPRTFGRNLSQRYDNCWKHCLPVLHDQGSSLTACWQSSPHRNRHLHPGFRALSRQQDVASWIRFYWNGRWSLFRGGRWNRLDQELRRHFEHHFLPMSQLVWGVGSGKCCNSWETILSTISFAVQYEWIRVLYILVWPSLSWVVKS